MQVSLSSSRRSIRSLIWVVGSIVIGILGLAFVYWPMIAGRFAMVSSDSYDGLIMVSLLEHWYGVLRGREAALTPVYFHPFANTLAYNDGNLISGLLYSVPRFLGLDPFLSYELTNWTVRLIGCFSMIAVARLILKLDILRSFAAGFLLVTLTSLSLRMGHAQLLFASFMPLGLLVFAGTFECLSHPLTQRWQRYAAVAGFAGFVFVWAMTAFYSFYIFGFLLALSFCFALVLSPDIRGKAIFIVRSRFDAVGLGAALLGIVVLAVFQVYGKAQAQGHPVEVLRMYAAHWADLLNVGTRGNIWSSPVSNAYRIVTGKPMADGELTAGFTPILFLTFVVTTIALFIRRSSREAKLAAALALGCLVVGFLSLKTGERANWEWFFLNVPGARALRVPARFLILVAPAVILVVAFGLGKLKPVVAAMLILVMAAEQYRTDLVFNMPRRQRIDQMSALPNPPSGCKSFYVSVPLSDPIGNDAIDRYYSHSVDAMLWAEYFGIPTVNGVATFMPAGWDLHSPFAADYIARVRAYAERMGVRAGLCALDLKANTWSIE